MGILKNIKVGFSDLFFSKNIMKSINPRNLIILISLFTAAIQFVVLFLFNIETFYASWKIIIISSLSTFLIVYFFASYTINKFFIQTIKPIYKIISNVKLDSNQIEENLQDSNFDKNLEFEVDKWAKEKTKQIAHLRQMEKYRREFLGDVSHELKTPIFTIQGYISTLIEGGIDDPEINIKYLQRTEKSIDRLISIVEDLISISQLESGQLAVNKEKFDISVLLNEIIEMQEERASRKKVEIKLNIEENAAFYVYADKKLIYQVLVNLIVNSIYYGKENGQTDISIYDMDSFYMIDIADNGIGISNKDLPRLFERFYRVDKSRSKAYGGTGLGLAICKHIIEAHQQTINVSSILNQGSSFSFTLDKFKKIKTV